MARRLRPGDRVDDWSVVRGGLDGSGFLGGGGNADVYEASDGERRVALKVLRAQRSRGDAYRRFRDEIAFQQAHASDPGLLPLLGSFAPDPLPVGRRAWLATTLATGARDALGPSPTVDEVLVAVFALAATLARLAAAGASHRDIKPDNIFRLGDRWVLGDFGLVAFPEKDHHTQAARRVGSRYFIAPEMEQEAHRADPAPADVYALGKTLWVLVSGRPPFEGGVLLGVEALSIASYIDDPRAGQLDLLTAAATRHNPSERPSMAEFAEEVDALRTGLARSTDVPSVAQLARRLRPHLHRSQRLEEERVNRAELRDQTMQLMQAGLSPTLGLLSEALGDLEWARSNDVFRFAPMRSSKHETGIGSGAIAFGPQRTPGVELVVALMFVVEVFRDRQVHMAAGLAIAETDNNQALGLDQRTLEIVWTDRRLAAAGSALAAKRARELHDGLATHATHAIERYADLLDGMGKPSQPDNSPPRLLEFTIEPRRVDTGLGSSTVTLRAHIIDEVAGVAGVGYPSSPSQVRFRSPGGQEVTALFTPDRNLVTGNRFDGVYEDRVALPEHAEAGSWRAEYFLLVDQVGNSTTLNADELEVAGLPATFVNGV